MKGLCFSLLAVILTLSVWAAAPPRPPDKLPIATQEQVPSEAQAFRAWVLQRHSDSLAIARQAMLDTARAQCQERNSPLEVALGPQWQEQYLQGVADVGWQAFEDKFVEIASECYPVRPGSTDLPRADRLLCEAVAARTSEFGTAVGRAVFLKFYPGTRVPGGFPTRRPA